MRIHFLPRFVLRMFKGDHGLLELDKLGGTCQARNIEIAGQRENFWPEGIEHGLMRLMDDRASKILQSAVFGRKRINLTTDERLALSEWLALWIVRVPKNLERQKLEIMEAQKNPEMGIEILFENNFGAIEAFKGKHPEMYEKIVDFCGGHALARGYMLQLWAKQIREGHQMWLPLPHDSFVQHVESGSCSSFAPMISKMTWTWLSSPNLDFVIGDDPVCRFGTAQNRWDYGIVHGDVEVTIPLAHNLCLLLTNHSTEARDVIYAEDEQVLTFNRRQITSALQHIYGPSQTALRPDDEAAAYGF
jgi:hypothetical protein